MKNLLLILCLSISCISPLSSNDSPQKDSSTSTAESLPQCHDPRLDKLIKMFESQQEEQGEQTHYLKIIATLAVQEEQRRVQIQQQKLQAQQSAELEEARRDQMDFLSLVLLHLAEKWGQIFTKQNLARITAEIILSPIDTTVNRSTNVYNKQFYQATDYIFGDGGDWTGETLFGTPLGFRPGENLGFISKEKRLHDNILQQLFIDTYGQVPSDLHEFETKIRAGLRADEIIKLYEKYHQNHPQAPEFRTANAQEVSEPKSLTTSQKGTIRSENNIKTEELSDDTIQNSLAANSSILLQEIE